MNKELFVGVDLGGTKIYTALVKEDGTIISECVVPTESEKGADYIKKSLLKTIETVTKDVKQEEIAAIGIGSPGPLDIKKGLIIESANLPFKNFNIVQAVKDVYKDIPVYLDNDANVATLGEFVFGGGKGTENMIYVTASTGIGGGAILNKRIFRGSTSNALEIGHTTVMQGGRRCGCGNRGCVEAIASGTAIGRAGVEATKSNARTSLKEYDVVTSKEVFIEASKGDKVAQDIINESLSYLGILFANLANSYDPDVMILGGGVANAGEVVFEKIKEVMEVRCLRTIFDNVKVKKAVLGGKAGVLGAAALAITETRDKERAEKLVEVINKYN